MVLWFGELRFAGKLQLWTWKKLKHRTAVFFTSMDPTSYVVFVVTSLPWTHGLRTDWFLVRCNFKPDAIFGKCGELALHVFLSLWFSPEALRANFINVTSFLRKVCGPYLVHTAAGRRLAVGVTFESSGTWGPSEETTSILHCEILSSDWQSWRTDPEYRTSTW